MEVEEGVYVRAAALRARIMGNRSTEEQIRAVSRRPVFREPLTQAYKEGWMDALIHMEEKRGCKRSGV